MGGAMSRLAQRPRECRKAEKRKEKDRDPYVDGYDKIENVSVKLILRDKEYEVKPGMTLLSALQKNNIVPESVIATREGEMILEDEILKDGDIVKLIAVISGGTGIGTWESGIVHEPRIMNHDSQRRQP